MNTQHLAVFMLAAALVLIVVNQTAQGFETNNDETTYSFKGY